MSRLPKEVEKRIDIQNAGKDVWWSILKFLNFEDVREMRKLSKETHEIVMSNLRKDRKYARQLLREMQQQGEKPTDNLLAILLRCDKHFFERAVNTYNMPMEDAVMLPANFDFGHIAALQQLKTDENTYEELIAQIKNLPKVQAYSLAVLDIPFATVAALPTNLGYEHVNTLQKLKTDENTYLELIEQIKDLTAVQASAMNRLNIPIETAAALPTNLGYEHVSLLQKLKTDDNTYLELIEQIKDLTNTQVYASNSLNFSIAEARELLPANFEHRHVDALRKLKTDDNTYLELIDQIKVLTNAQVYAINSLNFSIAEARELLPANFQHRHVDALRELKTDDNTYPELIEQIQDLTEIQTYAISAFNFSIEQVKTLPEHFSAGHIEMMHHLSKQNHENIATTIEKVQHLYPMQADVINVIIWNKIGNLEAPTSDLYCQTMTEIIKNIPPTVNMFHMVIIEHYNNICRKLNVDTNLKDMIIIANINYPLLTDILASYKLLSQIYYLYESPLADFNPSPQFFLKCILKLHEGNNNCFRDLLKASTPALQLMTQHPEYSNDELLLRLLGIYDKLPDMIKSYFKFFSFFFGDYYDELIQDPEKYTQLTKYSELQCLCLEHFYPEKGKKLLSKIPNVEALPAVIADEESCRRFLMVRLETHWQFTPSLSKKSVEEINQMYTDIMSRYAQQGRIANARLNAIIQSNFDTMPTYDAQQHMLDDYKLELDDVKDNGSVPRYFPGA